MISTQGDFIDVLGRVRSWAPDVQLALAHHVLENLSASDISSPRRRWKMEQVVGLLRTNSPPPTDDECQRILEEERVRKFG